MNRSLVLSSLWSILVLLTAFARCEEGVVKVGQFGDPKCWQLTGVKAFDEQEIVRRLSTDFDVVIAAHPQAPLDKLAPVLQKRLQEGYRSLGFSSASAHVRINAQRRQVVIRVTEGKRHSCGLIRVIGLEDQLAERVRVALTTKQLPETAVTPVLDDKGEPLHWLDKDGEKVKFEKALWVAGKPGAFHQSVLDSIDRRVALTLANTGYMAPKFTHELVADGSTAELVIRVHDLGAPAVLREIDVSGNERNSRDEIMHYLNLRIGQRFATAERLRAMMALRESARFITSRVTTESMDANGGVKLNIDVKELSVAPRLSEPLSREDLALMKLRHWETQGAGRLLDRVFHGESQKFTVDCVVSPTSGVIATIRIHSDDRSQDITHSLLASTQQTALFNLNEKRCFVYPAASVKLDLSTRLSVRGENIDRPYKFSFGMSLSAVEEDEPSPPIEFRTANEPVYYLALGRQQPRIHSWRGDILTLRTDLDTITVDSKTGCLLERTLVSGQRGRISFTRSDGAFEKAAAQLEQTSADFSNEYDDAHPVSSAVRYGWSLLEVFAAFLPDDKSLQQAVKPDVFVAIEKLLDQGLLDRLDGEIASADKAKKSDGFSIPPSMRLSLTMASVARVAAMLTDSFFERDTWPSSLWRETALNLAGHREFTSAELVRVVNDPALGPIGHLMLADLLLKISPPAARSIAARGLRRVDRQDFDRDLDLLTAKWPESANRLFHAMASLSDGDVAALGRIVSADTDDLIRLHRILRQSDSDDSRAVLLDALGQMWSDEWRQKTIRRLQDISIDRLPRVANERTKSLE